MDTLEAIKHRYSCRAFKPEQISKEQTEMLIEAAKAAPAAMGDYSGISLTVIQSGEMRKRIDKETAFSMPMMGEHPTYEAPTLMLISIKGNKEFPMIPYCNASCMAENIMIEATALGLASVYIMAVPTVLQQKKELMKRLEIEDGFIPVVMVAVGYAKDEVECKRENKITCKCISNQYQ